MKLNQRIKPKINVNSKLAFQPVPDKTQQRNAKRKITKSIDLSKGSENSSSLHSLRKMRFERALNRSCSGSQSPQSETVHKLSVMEHRWSRIKTQQLNTSSATSISTFFKDNDQITQLAQDAITLINNIKEDHKARIPISRNDENKKKRFNFEPKAIHPRQHYSGLVRSSNSLFYKKNKCKVIK